MTPEEEAVSAFAIRVEKELCSLLGRQWSAEGMSIASLIGDIRERLSNRRRPMKDDPEWDQAMENLIKVFQSRGFIEDGKWFCFRSHVRVDGDKVSWFLTQLEPAQDQTPAPHSSN